MTQLFSLSAGAAWAMPLAALLLGLLTSFTPCCLSSVPLVLTVAGGRPQKTALRLSLVFVLGMACTFCIFGLLVSALGQLIDLHAKWWNLCIAALLCLMALQTWELFTFIPSRRSGIAKQGAKGYGAAFGAGILGGLFSSPCCTPVLVALLALVADGQSVWFAFLILLCYSAGHGALAVVTAGSAGLVQKMLQSEKYHKLGSAIRIILGIAMLGLGYYFFWMGI
ncbi:MAG: sulfite exporter TauE/SafE family protein [Clostridiales bacterium]|nr:sulfite exporter TauE/SafE family protein [Clostridiales bacterium]